MKTIKYLLIDPVAQTVTTVEIPEGIQAIYDALQCETFTPGGYLDDEHAIYCDDEGLFDAGPGFSILSLLDEHITFPISGRGLVNKVNEDGDGIDVTMTPEDLLNKYKVLWHSKEEIERYIDTIS